MSKEHFILNKIIGSSIFNRVLLLLSEDYFIPKWLLKLRELDKLSAK